MKRERERKKERLKERKRHRGTRQLLLWLRLLLRGTHRPREARVGEGTRDPRAVVVVLEDEANAGEQRLVAPHACKGPHVTRVHGLLHPAVHHAGIVSSVPESHVHTGGGRYQQSPARGVARSIRTEVACQLHMCSRILL